MVDFAKLSMKKDIAGLFNLRGGVAGFSKMCVRCCGEGFFLKNGAGEVCGAVPRPARSPRKNSMKNGGFYKKKVDFYRLK